ncbi:MAG: hypothetical protein ACP5J5_00735 [Dissulfurimicrobium sp.]|uniref:hypothetical protein n=1 Tax=Dissulfurimicrobium TaxID=1769732 RepID=UPI001EDC8AC3|nr:hypothetical protein [Dissulfurimicrobium hydrothermale]UKL13248.1 hypothetical protein LGS26_07100 [Dissulfurimicrobium hydrothermale]
MGSDTIQPHGEKMRKAVKWMSEMINEHPDKDRREIILEAELRFDLSPSECEFLNKKFICAE